MRSTSRLLVCTLAFLLGACGDDGPTAPDDTIAGGVDLGVLFAAPTSTEIDAVAAQWAARTPAATDVTTEIDSVFTPSGLTFAVRVRVVSHVVDGFRHVGAIVTADGVTGPAPVVVYTHGGDGGVAVEDLLQTLPVLGTEAADFVWVVPSFRSESLRFAGETYTSQGTPSPWDRDVDDALSLFEVALSVEAAADETSVGVLGFSRGAGVALLMAIRDDRIDRVVEFFGPTDFFDVYVRDVVAEALRGTPRDLPGLDWLDATYLQPLALGEKTIAEVRLELVRRSAVLFAEELPAVQIHHGTADAVVEVSQAESLIATLAALGRSEPDVQSYLYDGGTHNFLTLSGSVGRASEFLVALLPAPVAE
jgi:dipeptidyl aminopeptidase/acylaminoacyl peptidase